MELIIPDATLEYLSPLKAWLQAQTAEGACQAFHTTLLCPLVLSPPCHCFGWATTANLCLPRLKPPGSQHCLRNNPEYNHGTAEDQVEGSGALTRYCWHHTSAHCIYEGSNTPWVHTQKSWRTAFSQTCCLYSCNKMGLCLHIPHILPIPKSHLLHLPLTCFSTNPFSVFSLTPCALPTANKAPAMPVDLALVQLLRLEAWLWAAALLLLYC